MEENKLSKFHLSLAATLVLMLSFFIQTDDLKSQAFFWGTQLQTGESVKQIATGANFTCALFTNGRVKCWGENDLGQLGLGHRSDMGDNESPIGMSYVNIGGFVKQIDSGYMHSCALLADGNVRCWGSGANGHLGYGNTTNVGDGIGPSIVAAGNVQVGGKVKQIVAGTTSTCALLVDGNVRCWGDATEGRLGYGNINNIGDDELPSSAGDVNIGAKVKKIAIGGGNTCALLVDGNVKCWGKGSWGGNGNASAANIGDDEAPAGSANVTLSAKAVDIKVGGGPNCAVLVDGNVNCWGPSTSLGLGLSGSYIGDNETPASMGTVSLSNKAISIDSGGGHTCVVLVTGEIQCWGQNGRGQLGYGNTTLVGSNTAPTTPSAAGIVPATALDGRITQVEAGAYHTCALFSTGKIKCWGWGADGRLGYADIIDRGDTSATTPDKLGYVGTGGEVRVKQVVATPWMHTCAIFSNGSAKCWGYGQFGQLGYGHTDNIGDTNAKLPAIYGPISIGGKVKQIVGGVAGTCAVLENGKARCWGLNDGGQSGYGNTNTYGDDDVPAKAGDVAVTEKIVQMAYGNHSACALLENGNVKCWGSNGFGQSGYGNTTQIGDNELPSSVGTLSLGEPAVQIDGNHEHYCALLASGSIRCWGRNTYGQLGYDNTNNIGDNELPSSAGPVNLGGAKAIQVSAGTESTCALLETGNVRCWGYGANGRLGYGNTNNVGDGIGASVSTIGDVSIGEKVISVEVGNTFACGLLESGRVRCWGEGAYLGQGNSTTIGDDEVPSTINPIQFGSNVVQMSLGTSHGCVLLEAGNVMCWGYGTYGQLGYGNGNFIGDDELPYTAGTVKLFPEKDNDPPPNPTNLTATPVSGPLVNLSWLSGGGSTCDYRISYQTGATAPADCATGTTISENLIYSNNYTVTGLAQSTQYSFRVCAINCDLPTPEVSSGITATTTTWQNPPPDPTSPVATAVATATTPSRLNLSWTSGGGSTADYRISYLMGVTAPSSCTTGNTISEASITGTSHSVTGLVADTLYTFRICAINSNPTPDQSSGVVFVGTTMKNSITAGALTFSGIGTNSFTATLAITDDGNMNATATLYYCDQTDHGIPCNPESYATTTMTRSGQTFTKAVSGLISPYDPYDLLNVRVVVSDTDGVTGSPVNGTVRLSAYNPGGLTYAMALQPDNKRLLARISGPGGGIWPFGHKINSNGSVDTTFQFSPAVSNRIMDAVVQADGKYLLVGQMTAPYSRIMRYNSDGTLDATFNPGTGFSAGSVWKALVQPDGKVLASGEVTSYRGNTFGYFLRINSDGTYDSDFNSGGVGFNSAALTMAFQSDGKILVGGRFSQYNTISSNRLARINTDGSLDATFNIGTGFNTAAWSEVRAIAVQSDGKILVGGTFTTYQGITHNRIIRLNSDGSIDGTFNSGTGFGSTVLSIVIQPDNKILVGGAFGSYNNVYSPTLIRLNSDGTVDTGFDVGTGGDDYVHSVRLHSDGKITVVGWFRFFNGVFREMIARLNSDGSIDSTFLGAQYLKFSNFGYFDNVVVLSDNKYFFTKIDLQTGGPTHRLIRLNNLGRAQDTTLNIGTGFNREVMAVLTQSDNKIVVGGEFNTYNGSTYNKMLRINNDGSVDGTFSVGSGFDNTVYAIERQGDGKYLVGGYFTNFQGSSQNRMIRLNSDGTKDNTFSIGTGFNGAVRDLKIQSDGKIVAVGNFTSFNGTSINRVARINLDGSIDSSFNIGTGLDALATSLEIQNDGKIVVGGYFNNFNGVAQGKITRLNSDGSRDTGFSIGTGFASNVEEVSLQTDGKIVVSSRSTTFNGVNTNAYPIRLNSDGTRDTGFTGATCSSYSTTAKFYSQDWRIGYACSGLYEANYGEIAPSAPPDPINLVATPVATGTNPSRIDLTWSSGGGSTYDYRIAYAVGATAPANCISDTWIHESQITGTSYSALNLLPNTQYSFRLCAINNNQPGDASAGVTVTATTLPNSSTVSNLAFSFISGTGFTASIDVSGDGNLNSTATLYYCDQGGHGVNCDPTTQGSSVMTRTGNKLVTSVSGLIAPYGPGDTLNVRVVASDGDGVSGSPINTTVKLTPDVLGGAVNEIALQSNNYRLIGGGFTQKGAVAFPYMGRINTDGSLDTSFALGLGFDGIVETVVQQNDGKFIVAGQFTQFNGTSANRIVRLNADGSLDSTFNMGTGFNSRVRTLAIQNDGKIVVGGEFTTYQGSSYVRIIRLNADGSIDTSFNPGTGFNNSILRLRIQSDGKIILTGYFSTYKGVAVSNPVRLNSDGTVDSSYNIGTGFDNNISDFVLQSDNKAIFVGWFTTVNGTTQNYITRLTTTGAIDLSYNIGTGFNQRPQSIAIQSDGKVVIPGGFSTYNTVTVDQIVRLNTDGTLDTSFTPTGSGLNSTAMTAIIGLDGKILVTGSFTNYNGTSAVRIVKLNSNGTLDNTFITGAGIPNYVYPSSALLLSDGKLILGGNITIYNNGSDQNYITRRDPQQNTDNTYNIGSGLSASVQVIKIQSDGKALVGGWFATFNGTSQRLITRINTDGSRDTGFNIGTGFDYSLSSFDAVHAIDVQSDGKIIIGGEFDSYNGSPINRIIRLNADGSVDGGFAVGTGFDATVRSIKIQSDGKIIVGGDFADYNGNSVSRIVRLNSDGTVDPGFTIGAGFTGGVVNDIEIQTDNKILVAGTFTDYNGTARGKIARLNTDGTNDAGFNIGAGFLTAVNDIALQPDGKIVAGGIFSTFDGNSSNKIARINTDGTFDATFNIGSGFNNTVNAVTVTSDYWILVGGSFGSFNGQLAYNYYEIPPAAPPNPTNVVATTTTSTRIILTWNGGGTATDYRIAYKVGETAPVNCNSDITVDETQVSGTSHTFTNLYPSTFYAFRVCAINSNNPIDVSSGSTDSVRTNISRDFNGDGYDDLVVNARSSDVWGTRVNAMSLQSDGKLVVGGSFHRYSGTSLNYIVRINTDGTRDAGFNMGSGTSSHINALAIQSDGKVVAGGNFITYNGTAQNYITRINTNGSRDTGFTIGNGFNNNVYALAMQSDGKIVVGGEFTSYDGTTQNRITRLNTDGTRDTGFTIGNGFNGIVKSIVIQSDGKIVVGGEFTDYDGTTQNKIARLNTDGTRDTGFTIGTGFNNNVNALSLQSDGKIVVGGVFTSFDGTTQNRITRLNTDGTRDTGFTIGTGFNNNVNALSLQSDGKIVVGGVFTSFDGTTQNRITRLNTDGTRDTGFTIGTGFNSYVNAIAVQSDGKIPVGGNFVTYDGTTQSYISRMNSDGTRDTGYNIGGAFEGMFERAIYIYFGSATGVDSGADHKRYDQRLLYPGPDSGSNFANTNPTIGDVNGDGYADLALPAITSDIPGGINKGVVYVYFGGPNGLAGGTGDLANTDGSNGKLYNQRLMYEGSDDAPNYGNFSSGGGDFNKDGFDDYIISAPNSDIPGVDMGVTYVYFGSVNGLSNGTGDLANTDGTNGKKYDQRLQYPGADTNARFGGWLIVAGDVNGDGYADAALNAQLANEGGTDLGAVYIYFGGPNGLSGGTGDVANSDGMNGKKYDQKLKYPAADNNARFGLGIVPVGDLNKDGYGDLAVSTGNSAINGAGMGVAFIYYGSPNGLANGTGDVANTDGMDGKKYNQRLLYPFADAGASFGNYVTSGYLNNDGYGDLLVNAGGADYNSGTNLGITFVYYGSSNGLANGTGDVANTDGTNGKTYSYQLRYPGTDSNTSFGAQLTARSDLNGDGLHDVVIGSPFSDLDSIDTGRVFILYSTPAGLDAGVNYDSYSDYLSYPEVDTKAEFGGFLDW